MSLIQTQWTSQPQQAVEIDWSNPITRGLVRAINFADGQAAQCAVSKKFVVTSGAPQKGITKSGGSLKTVAVSSQYAYIDVSELTAGPLTVFSSHVLDSSAQGAVVSLGTVSGTERAVLFYGATAGAYSVNFNPNFGGTDGTISSAIGVQTSAAFTLNSSNVGAVWVNGAYSVNSYSWQPTGAITRIYLSTRMNSTAGIFASVRHNVLIAFNRALSDSEIRSLSQNPWQIFKPLPRRIFVPVAAGDPTLYPSLYTNTNSFYAPTVSVGAVTLTPSLFSNSNTFHSATVTLGGSAQTLTPSLYSNTNTFHAPSVTTGAVTLTPSLVTNTNTFYGHSVSPGAVTLTPALFSNTNSFFGAVVTLDSDKILYPSLVSNTNSFYGPTVSVGAVSLLPSLFVNSNSFYSHVVGGALTDSEKIDLILDILSNRQTLDATTGIYTLYADDGVTVLKTAQAWEDAEGNQPYRGRGLKRLDAMQ